MHLTETRRKYTQMLILLRRGGGGSLLPKFWNGAYYANFGASEPAQVYVGLDSLLTGAETVGEDITREVGPGCARKIRQY